MNVVLCSREYPGITPSGGIGVYIESMAKELLRQGHRVHVITEQPSQEGIVPSEWTRRDEHCLRHPLGYWVHFIVAQDGFRTNPHGYSYSLFEALRDLTGSERIDVVEFPDYQGEGYYAIKAKRLLGYFSATTLMVHGHMSLELVDGLNGENAHSEREAIFRIERYAIQYADVATVPCDDLADLYRTSMPRPYLIKRHPVPELPQVLDSYTPSGSDRPVILYVGRLEHRKGVDRLIAAAQHLLEEGLQFHVRLIGGDTELRGKSYRSRLQSMISAPYRSAFEFVGRVDRGSLMEHYQRAALVCLPSRFENWPNVALEAMAQGALLMGSTHGGMREMLQDGAGIVIDPLEDGAIEEVMRWAITHPEDAQAFRRQARNRARQYATRPLEGYDTYTGKTKPGSGLGHGHRPSMAVAVAVSEETADIMKTLDALLPLQDDELMSIAVGVDNSVGVDIKSTLRRAYGSKITLIETPKRGLAAARNAAARGTDAEVIAFCDAGDLWSAMGLRGLSWAFAEQPHVTALAPMLEFTGERDSVFAPEDIFNPSAAQRNVMPGPLAVRRRLFDKLGGYDEHLKEGFDAWDFALRLANEDYIAEMLPLKGAYQYAMNAVPDGRLASKAFNLAKADFLSKYPHLSPAVAMSSVLMHRVYGANDLPVYNAAHQGRRDRWVNSKVGQTVLKVSGILPVSIKSPIRALVVKVFHFINPS